MRQKSGSEKQPAEDAIRDIRRATRRHSSAEEKSLQVTQSPRCFGQTPDEMPCLTLDERGQAARSKTPSCTKMKTLRGYDSNVNREPVNDRRSFAGISAFMIS